MHRCLSSSLALAGLAIGFLMSTLPSRAEPAAQIGPPPSRCPSSCIAAADYGLSPALLLHGEATTVTLRAKSLCAGFAVPMHIVFVVDGSEPLDAGDLRKVQSDLRLLVERLDLPDNPSTQAALVEVSDRSRTLVRMTHEPRMLQRGISRLGRGGPGGLADGIDEGMRELRRARIPECQSPSTDEIMVIYAAEPPDGRCPEAERALWPVKNQGVLVVTVCAGNRCGPNCLRRLASSARYVFRLGRVLELSQVFERIRDGISYVTIREMTVVEQVAPNMIYVDASALPPADYDAGQRQLTWRFDFAPSDGITLTWRLRPRLPGFHAVSEGAELAWRDNLHRRGGAAFLGVPWVQVFGASYAPR